MARMPAWRRDRAAPRLTATGLALQACVVLLLAVGIAVCAAGEEAADTAADADPAQECMMALLSPDLDGVYDATKPEFEVAISSGCGCPPDDQHEIEIRVSRENNKRHLNATTFMPCSLLKTDGAFVELVDLRDGLWEGTVAINTLDLYHDVRFTYVTRFNPRIEVLLPVPGYVFGRNTNPVIVVHVCDVTVPEEPLIGVKMRVTVNGDTVGYTQNPGRDKYIHLRMQDGTYFDDGMYQVELQTVDLLDRPRGDPVQLVVAIDRTVETGVQGTAGVDVWCPVDDKAEICPKCSAHGRCDGGSACECEADWIGELCEHHILFHTHYLPPASPLPTASVQCQRQRQWDSQMVALAREVDRLQNPPDCAADGVQFLTDNKRHPLALGHGLRWEALMLGESVRNRSAYLPGPTWALFDYHECRNLGLWCHFQHPSSCKAANVKPEADKPSQVEVVHVKRLWELAETFKDMGLFQWSSTLMGLVARPRGGMQAKLQRLKSTVGFQHPIIGLHVRYGDGCLPNQMHRPACEPIEAYMDELRRMGKQYNVSRVYVASDSADVIDKLQEMGDMQVLHMPLDRSMFDSQWWIDHRAAYGLVDRKQVAESAVLDMLMLAECDYFIGTFSSHFSMAAFEISAYKKGHVPPYVRAPPSAPNVCLLCSSCAHPCVALSVLPRSQWTARGSQHDRSDTWTHCPIANAKSCESADTASCRNHMNRSICSSLSLFNNTTSIKTCPMCWSEKRRWPNKIRIALACGCNSRLLVNRDMKGLARDHCAPFDSVGAKH